MAIDSNECGEVHVLVVSNHWNKKERASYGGIWADRQVDALRSLGVRVTTFDIGSSHSPVHLAHSWIRLRKTVKELKPDLIHARYGTLVGFLSVLGGARTIITYAGSDLLPDAGVSWLRARVALSLSNFAALLSAGIICVSEGLREALWVQRDRAVIIPDGVNLDLFRPYPVSEARMKLGWPLDDQVVLMDALRDPICKGLALGQTAIALVKQRLPRARLELIMGVSPTDMPLYCSAADVLLCASFSEGSPNIVKEAMACNLPVVSSDVGDVRERLKHVSPSRIVPRRSNEMAAAICEILETGKRSNGRDHILDLSLDQMAQRVLTVYREVLHESS